MHVGNEFDFIRLAFSLMAFYESCFPRRFQTSCRQAPEVGFFVTQMPARFLLMCSVSTSPSFGEGGRGVFLSAHHLGYLEQTLNNDRNYLDEGGHLSNYSELHWTVPKFSAHYLKVNVAEQYQDD